MNILTNFRYRFLGLSTAIATVSLLVANAAVFDAVIVAQTPSVCNRTEEVKALILQSTGATDCASVTEAHLNAITGTYTFNDASFMSGDLNGLSSLEGLKIEGESVTEIPDDLLDDLTGLTSFDVSRTSLQALPANFVESPPGMLIDLYLRDIGFSPLPNELFSNLPDGMVTIVVTETRLTNSHINSIASLPNLRSVEFKNVGLDGESLNHFFEELPDINSLDSLNLQDDDTSTWFKPLKLERDKNALKRAPNLLHLTMNVNNYGWSQLNEILAALPETLDTLSFSAGQPLHGDVDADEFSRFTALNSLTLSNVGIDADDADQIVDNLPATMGNSLSFRDNSFGRFPTTGFSKFTNLDSLGLSGNDLTQIPPNAFDGMSGLRRLFLDNNHLSEIPANVFDSLDQLEVLNLQRNALTTIDLSVFSEITDTLTFLELRLNPLTKLPTETELEAAGFNLAQTAILMFDICRRSLQVQGALLANIDGVNDCLDVTAEHLDSITGELHFNEVSFKPGDLNGLTNLEQLIIQGKTVTQLPEDLLDELTELTHLEFRFTSLVALPITFLDMQLSNLEQLVLNDPGQVALAPALFIEAPSTLTHFTISDVTLNGDQIRSIAAVDTLTDVRLINVGIDGALLTEFLLALSQGNSLAKLYVVGDDTSSWFGSPTRFKDKIALERAVFLRHLVLDVHNYEWEQVEAISENLPDDMESLVFLSTGGVLGGAVDMLLFDRFDTLNGFGLERVGVDDDEMGPILAEISVDLDSFLHFSGNLLTRIPADGFGKFQNLPLLLLNGNRISEVPANAFRNMRNLQVLDLSGNVLSEIDLNAFLGLDELTELRLMDNSLRTIDVELFRPVSDTLRLLDLRGNPLSEIPTSAQLMSVGFDLSRTEVLLPRRAVFVPEPTVFRVEPAITSVTLRAGESVRLGVDVYGIQDILDNDLADGVEVDPPLFSWSDGGRGGSFSEVTRSETRRNSVPDDRNVLYKAPDTPGTHVVLATVFDNAGCYTREMGETEDQAAARCNAIFEITVRRASAAADRAPSPVNPSGAIPTILTDSGGFAFSVFSPVEGGEFVGEGFGITAGPGAVPNGEIIGIAMANAGDANNIGKTYQRYTLMGGAYAVGLVDSSGQSVSSYRFNTFAEACIPLPDALRSNISDVSLTAINGDGTLTVLTSNVKLSVAALALCGRISSLPAIVAAGAEGAPSDFPTPVPGPEIETPDTGAAAPSNTAVMLLLLLGLALSTIGYSVRRTATRRS